MKSIAQLREKAPYVLKRKGHAKQKKKLLKAYGGKRLKEIICAHAAFEEMTISEMKKMEFDFYRDMKGGHRHNHVRNATARMRKCKECGDPIVKGMEARIELPLVRGRDDTMCRRCLRMLDEEIYHHNYLTVKEIEMMEADL